MRARDAHGREIEADGFVTVWPALPPALEEGMRQRGAVQEKEREHYDD